MAISSSSALARRLASARFAAAASDAASLASRFDCALLLTPAPAASQYASSSAFFAALDAPSFFAWSRSTFSARRWPAVPPMLTLPTCPLGERRGLKNSDRSWSRATRDARRDVGVVLISVCCFTFFTLNVSSFLVAAIAGTTLTANSSSPAPARHAPARPRPRAPYSSRPRTLVTPPVWFRRSPKPPIARIWSPRLGT